MDTSNTHPRVIKSWLEDDVHSPWRRFVRTKRETRRWTKRHTNQRERREARALIAEQLPEISSDRPPDPTCVD